jgi:SWI/SNF-related matrix-associated actin-dependent regulator 1 of chromatin subfamily A
MNSTLREQFRRAQTHLERRNRGGVSSSHVPPQPGAETFNRIESDIVVPVPEGLHYFGFQRAGIEFLASRQSSLLADEMGLGKTVQCAGLLNYLPEIASCLVVCPASLKGSWHRELNRWLCPPARSILVCNGNTAELGNAGIVIVNYDLLGKFYPFLSKCQWDLIIFDEGHYLKNPEATRTRHARELACQAKRRVILTGTPLLNRPSELWSPLNILAPARWPNFYRFAHRYCAPVRTSWGWDFRGSSNQEELSLELRRGLLLRRRKKHVLAQLPPIVRQVIPLAVDPSPLLKHLTCRVGGLYGFDPAHPPFEINPEKIPFELISEIRRCRLG